MSSRLDRLVILHQIFRASENIEQSLNGVDLQTYLENEMLQAAVERKLMVIGEAIVRLKTHQAEEFLLFPDAQAIIALRNRIVHEYDGLEPVTIYGIATRHLPALLLHVKKRLLELQPTPPPSTPTTPPSAP